MAPVQRRLRGLVLTRQYWLSHCLSPRVHEEMGWQPRSNADIAPKLLEGGIERSWTGLRPGSADELPLLGASRSRPGLWLASGHFRTGALQGPLTGHILAELIQGRAAPFGLDLSAFDPDRFGGWAG